VTIRYASGWRHWSSYRVLWTVRYARLPSRSAHRWRHLYYTITTSNSIRLFGRDTNHVGPAFISMFESCIDMFGSEAEHWESRGSCLQGLERSSQTTCIPMFIQTSPRLRSNKAPNIRLTITTLISIAFSHSCESAIQLEALRLHLRTYGPLRGVHLPW